jgi:hypothetical protein
MAWPFDPAITRDAALVAPFLAGFQPGEQAIAKAWLSQFGDRYDVYGFNVRVGEGVDAPPDAPDYAKRFVLRTTQKRIDVVAARAGGVGLYEVKIQANLGALGQMLGYRHLWELGHPDWPVTEIAVWCRYISPDTATVYEKSGLAFQLFADLDLPPLTQIPA